jgi:glyoxylase-like metal-dependent hydrolase (beta-lactamase superfamily II)
MALYFKQMELGPMQNFVYLIGNSETKTAAVVDPAWSVPVILRELAEDGYRLTHIFLTHGHYDHINGVEDLIEKTDATVCAQPVELEHFIPEGGGGLAIPRSVLKNTFTGSSVALGNIRIDLLPTPGHTPGSQCLLIHSPGETAPRLVTGDTLFMGACGRSDFPYSNPEQLYQSLTRLKKLDDQTVIYPGHDYGATASNPMGQEKKTNPFLLAATLDHFLMMTGSRRNRGL